MSKALLVGTPNSGKTALFNRLTGLNQRVANYPGITVDISVGKMKEVEDWDLKTKEEAFLESRCVNHTHNVAYLGVGQRRFKVRDGNPLFFRNGS